MTPLLLIEPPEGPPAQRPLQLGARIWVGRDPSCDVVLPSPEVSRRHVHFELGPGAVRVTDASANGTLVGEAVLRRQALAAPYGVPIRVGPYRLRFLESSEQAVASHLGAPPGQPAASQPHAGAVPPVPPTVAAGATPGARPDPALQPPPTPPQPAPAAPARDEPAWKRSSGAEVRPEVRRKIHRLLLDHLNLASLDKDSLSNDAEMRGRVRAALRRIVPSMASELPQGVDTAQLIDDLCDEALGLGPLEKLLDDPTISEIMVVDPQTIYVERRGRIELTPLRFTDDDMVRAVIERIVTPLGRRIDESTPLVDARLSDGSRVNAIIPPLALRGPCITIRRFSKTPLTMEKLIEFGAMTSQMARFLRRAVKARKNIVISGGTGSGKTTLLNVLSSNIPEHERIITIEDAAELQLAQPHVVSLESRPPNMEGKGEYSIRDLLRNALRMRPDRIIVGECRGGEALDMLQAMNTGHDGSMTTTHANSPAEALKRLETLALMAGVDLPGRAIREQIASSVDLIVQQARFSSDGSRKVTRITEIVGLNDEGEFETHDIFGFYRTGTGPDGKVLGEFRASGYLPSFIDEFIAMGLVEDGEYL